MRLDIDSVFAAKCRIPILGCVISVYNYMNSHPPVEIDNSPKFRILTTLRGAIFNSIEYYLVALYKKTMPFYKKLYLKYWKKSIIFWKEPYRSL